MASASADKDACREWALEMPESGNLKIYGGCLLARGSKAVSAMAARVPTRAANTTFATLAHHDGRFNGVMGQFSDNHGVHR